MSVRPVQPTLLAQLCKYAMGWTFFQFELSGDVGHSHPARFARQ
jgi:hypothetical protein